MINYNIIPKEIQEKQQWVCWRLEERDGKQTKIPYDPKTLKHASTTDPSTWGDFDTAKKLVGYNQCNGIGFVFTENDPYLFIDLDHCIDEQGNIDPEARRVIDLLNSYTEISQSGRGIHIIVKAKRPEWAGNRKDSFEIYDHSRYACMTGNVLQGYPWDIRERQAEIDQLCEQIFGKPSEKPAEKPAKQTTELKLSDQEIIEKAMKAKNGDKFQSLWSGNWSGYRSQSEAEMALVGILSFWTQDKEQIKRLMKLSGFERDKWDINKSYLGVTVDKNLANKTEVYDPKPKTKTKKEKGDPAETKTEAKRGVRSKKSEFEIHKIEVGHILAKFDLDTNEGKRLALKESETYINQITDPDLAGRLLEYVEKELRKNRIVETLDQFLSREKTQTPYIIAGGILPSQGFMLLAGETGVGKSTLAWQLCLCVLTGTPFMGFDILVDDVHILYLNFENTDYSIDKLLKAQLNQFGLSQNDKARLMIPDASGFELNNNLDFDFLKETIKHKHIDVVVIDPLLFSVNDDPNDPRAVIKYVKKLKQIKNADNEEIAWVLIHHYNKPSMNKNQPLHRIFGSSVWANSATSILTLERYAETRNPYYKRLDFVKIRDDKQKDYKVVAINEITRCFEEVEESTITKISTSKVVDILKEYGKPMQYKELVTQVEKRNYISDRTAKRLIKSAIDEGLVTGNNGIYTLKN